MAYAVLPSVDNFDGRTQGLTPRQVEALELLTEGLSNKQIARRMHIATSTVKAQLANAYVRLGVENRTQAAVTFLRLDRRDASIRQPGEGR